VRFLERFGNYEVQWTQESVIEFIELYRRREMYFNKIRKQYAWEEWGKK
jgi:hypothetical protein